MFRPLNDAVVLDLTRLLPGAYCTRLLSEYGAEVVKIERPDGGDYVRDIPPEYNGWSYRHMMDNFDKLSVALDLKEADGLTVFKTMVREADVIVENFRPAVTSRLGIDYDSVSSLKDDIVYVSISGFGQTGPYRDLPGHDINYLSVAGILGLTGEATGPPTIPGGMFADASAGVHAALGTLAALLERERTEQGEYVDVSMTDVSLAPMLPYLAQYLGTGKSPKRGQGRYLGSACYNVYEASDGAYLSIGALESKFWERLCQAIDRPDLTDSHLLSDSAERMRVREELASTFATRKREDWLEVLHEANVPATPVNDVDDIPEDEHIQARDMFQIVPHPEHGSVRAIGHPMKFGSTLRDPENPAPALGEHTNQVLKHFGYDEETIDELHRKGVVTTESPTTGHT